MSGRSSVESHGTSKELSNVGAGQLRRHASSLVLKNPFLGQTRSMLSMSRAHNDHEWRFYGFGRTLGLGEGAYQEVKFPAYMSLILL